MSFFPQGTVDMMRSARETAMADQLKVWDTEADDATEDPYDSTETVHYDGKASLQSDVKALRRDPAGDQALEAEATAITPLVEKEVEDALLDSRCKADFRGQVRIGRVTETRRREVTLAVGIAWD
jgi:hypothetical protein